MKFAAWLSGVALVVALIAIPLSLVSALGVVVALIALCVAGIAAAFGTVLIALFVLLITLMNIFFFSVASLATFAFTLPMVFMLAVPLIIFLLGIVIGVSRRRRFKTSTSPH